MYKGTLKGVLFALIVTTKIPLSNLFYTSAYIDAMDKYQVRPIDFPPSHCLNLIMITTILVWYRLGDVKEPQCN